MRVRSFFDGDDILFLAVDRLLEFLDQFAIEFEREEGGLHMLPIDPEVLGLDGHILVERDHVGALVVVGPAEEVREEEDHGGVQLGNVADVLEEEVVDALVGQHVLVELRHDLLELVVPAELLEQGAHQFIIHIKQQPQVLIRDNLNLIRI